MTSKIIKYVLWTGMFVSALSVSRFSASLDAQQSGTSATDAMQKARVLDRLAASAPAEHKGTSPGFVLDPAWPQPLPHHWVIGDVGGIAVDKHDHIWVYHRPRSVSSTDSGMQGAAGTDAKGNPISALGFARPNGQINGCCMPAPSVLVPGAVPVIRVFCKRNAASRQVASGQRVSMGFMSIRTILCISPAMAKPVIFMGSFRGRRTSEMIHRF
jgi:hypothetical protein